MVVDIAVFVKTVLRNRTQQVLGIAGGAIVVVMCLVPPWMEVSGRYMRPVGYDFLLERHIDTSLHVNLMRLFVQIAVTVAIFGSLIFVFKDKSAPKGGAPTPQSARPPDHI